MTLQVVDRINAYPGHYIAYYFHAANWLFIELLLHIAAGKKINEIIFTVVIKYLFSRFLTVTDGNS